MSYPKIMDAAVPPHTAPPGIEGVMGYIGGRTAPTCVLDAARTETVNRQGDVTP